MQEKKKRSKWENIRHLERAIRKFGDFDGSRKAALDRLRGIKHDQA